MISIKIYHKYILLLTLILGVLIIPSIKSKASGEPYIKFYLYNNKTEEQEEINNDSNVLLHSYHNVCIFNENNVEAFQHVVFNKSNYEYETIIAYYHDGNNNIKIDSEFIEIIALSPNTKTKNTQITIYDRNVKADFIINITYAGIQNNLKFSAISDGEMFDFYYEYIPIGPVTPPIPDDEELPKNDIVEISNYTDLPYNVLNNMIIKHVSTTFNVYKYDITFENEKGDYIIKNVGLPKIYNHEKEYQSNYQVKNVDDEKRVFLNLKDENGYLITYEATTGKYIANNVVTVNSAILHYEPWPDLNQKRAYVQFDIDIDMDDIYKIDVSYETFEKFLFWDINKEKHKETIYKNKIIREDTKQFNDFFNKIFGIDEDYSNIRKLIDDDYQWEADIGNIVETRYIKDFVILKFYYVTNEIYYESDQVIMDPISNVPDDDNIISDMEKLIKNIFKAIDDSIKWTKQNKSTILFIIILFIILIFLPGILPLVFSLISIFIKAIIYIIKSIINLILLIIKLPLTIINSFKKKSNKKMNKKERLVYKM